MLLSLILMLGPLFAYRIWFGLELSWTTVCFYSRTMVCNNLSSGELVVNLWYYIRLCIDYLGYLSMHWLLGDFGLGIHGKLLLSSTFFVWYDFSNSTPLYPYLPICASYASCYILYNCTCCMFVKYRGSVDPRVLCICIQKQIKKYAHI